MSVTRALAAAVLVLATACGGGDGDTADTIPPLDGSTTTTTSAPPAAPDATTSAPGSVPDLDPSAVVEVDDAAVAGEIRALVRTVEVGETVHYAGFDIDVHRVRFGFDPADFRVAVVDVSLTNNTPRDDRLQTGVEIESQGFVAVIDRDFTSDVPAGGTAEGSFGLRLDPSFTFDDAVLTIGRPDRQRVQVPLGSVGELVTREPVISDEGATESDGTTTVTVDTVTWSWDTADPRAQAEVGRAFLVVEYTLASGVATAVNDDTIMLLTPDGDVVAPVAESRGQVEADVPSPQVATFDVEDPVGDGYVLRYVERFGNGEVEVPLVIG